MTPQHPIRIIVSDDRRRSRLTVFFRLFLVIPHLLWAGFFAPVVFLMVFANWWVLLFTGKPSNGIHDFVARFLRYGTWLEAYVALIANPFPPFFLVGDENAGYPVDLEIGPSGPQSRWKTFFRFPLAIPALVLGTALTGASFGGTSYLRGGTLATAALLGWFGALFVGRMPRGLRDLGAWSIGYGGQLGGYLFLLTDRYPYTGPQAHVIVEGGDCRPVPEPPARLIVTGDLRRSRLTVFFRLPLLAPHIVWTVLWGALVVLVVPANWLCALVLGRAPHPFARFLGAFIRYQTHVNAFGNLVGNPFPGFVGKSASYPVDATFDPFGKQGRWGIAFRLVLALPALLVVGAGAGVLATIAVLGWFVSLVRGHMPEGLRDAGAWAIGYTAQASVYGLVLNSRYPFSGPALTPRQPQPLTSPEPLAPQPATRALSWV